MSKHLSKILKYILIIIIDISLILLILVPDIFTYYAKFHINYEFYKIVKHIVTWPMLIIAIVLYKEQSKVFALISLLIAILFNPIFPVHLNSRPLWVFIDIIVILFTLFLILWDRSILRIPYLQGNNLPNPLDLDEILSNFRKATPFKWLTHSTDRNQLMKDYDNFDGFIKQVQGKFAEIENNLKILSPNLYRKIYDFALNTNIEKSWCSKGDIKIGWSSLDGLKEWCDSGEKAFDFKLKEPIILDEKELINWKDVVELFKKEIEIRNDDAMLYEFFVEKRKKIRKDTNRLFSIELISEDDFKNKEFYTDVEEFSNAVDTILEMMTHNKRKEYTKIKVSVIDGSKTVGENNFLDIRITQMGSFADRDAKSLKKVVSGGDFDKIKTNLQNLCNWSIENSHNGKTFRVDYLESSSMGDFETLDYNVEGFTHILRFKKR